MNKKDRSEYVGRAYEIFSKAKNVYNELSSDQELSDSELSKTVEDAINNILDTIQAYLEERIPFEKIAKEIAFEEESLRLALENAENEPYELKRFVRKLRSSTGEYLQKSVSKSSLNLSGKSSDRFKSKGVAYLLWLISIFGWLGIHRFYLGKVGTGILWIFTGGMFYIGALYDLFALGGMVEQYNTKTELKTIRTNALNK